MKFHWIISVCWAVLTLGSVGGIRVSAARTPWVTSKVQGSPEPPAPCGIERVFPRLAFREPVDFAWEPGSQRYWVLQLNGQIFTFANEADPAIAQLVGDLAMIRAAAHLPLRQTLGFAFHPGFATNRLVYVCYCHTDGAPDGSQVSRFRITDANPPQLDPDSELPLISWRGGGHNGCSLKFGPDGMLYVSTGDSESPEPPDRLKTGQDISDLLSSILRINVDRPADGRNYSVPQDNPFRERPGARPEVWAYGFRNPWRTSFGPDGALWVGDVGWELWESIHRVTAGYNGGWSRVEGPQDINLDVLSPTPISAPIIVHGHHEAASITGGFFYFGKSLPQQRGAYVYGDWESGKIWALHHDGPRLTQHQELCDTTLKIIAFAPAADGEMLVMDYREGQDGAGIYRLVANERKTDPTTFPRRLSATGIFKEVATQHPADGVEEYRPVGTMWTDYASSQRWLGLPGESVVRTARGHPWSEVSWAFPSNAVLVKTLSLELTTGDRATRRRIETQVLHQDGEGWQAYTYRWNDAQTDAELVTAAGETVKFKVVDGTAPGGVREQTWRFHSRTECLRCHNFWPGTALAFGWDSLAGKAFKGSATNELARLAELGMVRETRQPEKTVAHLVDPYDSQAPLDLRARSWLHLNCAHCHRNGAGGAVSAYFNAELPLGELRILGVPPLRGNFGLPGGKILAPGDPWRSVLYYRASTTGNGHMPTLGSRLPDPAGLGLLREWLKGVQDREGRSLGDSGATATSRILQEKLPGETRTAALKAAFNDTAIALVVADAARTDPVLRTDAVAAAFKHPNSAAYELFKQFLRPDQLEPTLGDAFDPPVVLSLNGDPVRGRALFQSETGANCVRCHFCDGVGHNYGPDLTAVGKKFDRAALLQQILRPSATVAPEYVLHLVETKTGSSYSGFVVRSDALELVLRTETGEQSLGKEQISSDTKSSLSAMPEGLLGPLTAQEAADLLAYLAKSR